MPYRVFDEVEVRCPRLGGEVTFGYCRQLSEGGLPCNRALICFELKFPVAEYFKRVLKEETFRRIFLDPEESRYDKILRTFAEATERVEKG